MPDGDGHTTPLAAGARAVHTDGPLPYQGGAHLFYGRPFTVSSDDIPSNRGKRHRSSGQLEPRSFPAPLSGTGSQGRPEAGLEAGDVQGNHFYAPLRPGHRFLVGVPPAYLLPNVLRLFTEQGVKQLVQGLRPFDGQLSQPGFLEDRHRGSVGHRLRNRVGVN